jgi:hypothetical protein
MFAEAPEANASEAFHLLALTVIAVAKALRISKPTWHFRLRSVS